MRHALIALTVAALVVPAIAGQNPDIRVYLDADPPNMVHEICPATDTVFDVYVCLDCFGPGGGTRGARFWFDRAFGGIKIAQVNLLGGLDLGDVEDSYMGWMIVAGADCVYPDENDIVVAARVTYHYTGPPGTLDLAPDAAEPRATLDCNFQDDDLFCIAANLGVCVPANPGEVGCSCSVTSVEQATWGGIKALYR